ncbi:MAG TPA: histidine kinase dimerization/phosphoacceptor domain -containing protein [Chryseolinea sp.]|nr:histidine kinase dimerization/phosphoacceptor domain -containing protein [Chryseolinea sp.]
MRIISSIMLLLIPGMTAFGQPIEKKEADSLLRVLSNTRPASERMNILIRLAQFHIFKPGENQVDFDSAVTYLKEVRHINESIKSPSAEGQLLLTESFMQREKGEKEAARLKVEEAIGVLESSNDKYFLGKALYELSGYYDYHGPADYKKKVTLVERSVAAFQQSKGIREKADGLKMLGDLYSLNGDLDQAIDVLRHSLAAYDSINYKPLQGVYDLLGSIYAFKNDYKQAISYELLALKTAESCRDSSMQACQIISNLGGLYSDCARYEISLKYYRDALKIATRYDDRYAIALTVFNISKIFIFLKQPAASLDFLASLPPDLLKSTGALEKAFFATSFMDGYLNTRQYAKADYYCGVLLKLVDDQAIPPGVKSNIYRLAANYYLAIRDYSRARLYISKNIPISKTLPRRKYLSLDEKAWYKLDSAQGNFQSAFYHLLTYKTISDSLFDETIARQVQQLEVEYGTAKKEDSLKQKDQHIALLLQRNDLQQTNLKQAKLIRNITIAGIVVILIVLLLLYHQFRNNQRNNKIILQKNEELKDMLAEKEWWLKEVHHRVKNNLHTIICLLESQAMYLEKDALQAIEKSQHRIYAMSLIHQKLYQNEDLQVIDMSVYLEEFIGYLKDSFDTNNIEFIIKVEPVQLNLQQAIPVALIINEGVTNAIKYAFRNEEDSKIWVSMSETDATVKLTIRDNGSGFELNEETERKSLGMQLIRGLSKELKGTVLIETKDGTKLSIVFKKGPLGDKIPALQEDKIG